MMSYVNWSRIKHVASIILLVCMFLPLSQCQIQPPPNKPEQAVKIEVNQALHTSMKVGVTWQNSAVALLFLAPFLISFIVLLRRDIDHRLGEPLQIFWFLSLMEFLSIIAIGIILFIHSYLGTPLYGLYLSTVLVVVYTVAWAGEMIGLKRATS